MEYSFSAKGHRNVLSEHRTTLEFTKEKELTLKGDCILGVEADFSLAELKKFLGFGRIRIRIEAGGEAEEITATPNRTFSSDEEIVIRKSDFSSERTFATKADKAASDIGRKLVDALRKGEKASIEITTL